MWINLSGSYAERSGGLFRIFVAEIDVVPDPMLPAKGEQDAKPPTASTAVFTGLAGRASRFGDIWHMSFARSRGR